MFVDVLLLITRPTANKMDHTTLTTVMTCIAWKLTSTNNKTRSYFKFGFLPFGKQRDLGSNPPRLSFLFKEVVACGHCLATLSLTINAALKWLPSLPTLMQESFWWWQCSDRYIISLSTHLPRHFDTPFPPFSPSLISLNVSVDVKHRVWWSRASCPRMSVDILGTNYDQCRSMVQCCFTSTETIRHNRTESPGRPPRLSHSSWALHHVYFIFIYYVRSHFKFGRKASESPVQRWSPPAPAPWCFQDNATPVRSSAEAGHSPGGATGRYPKSLAAIGRSMCHVVECCDRSCCGLVEPCLLEGQNYWLWKSDPNTRFKRTLIYFNTVCTFSVSFCHSIFFFLFF